MISVFVDPGYRPPIPCGPCYNRPCTPTDVSLDKDDLALLRTVEKAGVYGICVWELLNRVADEQNPTTRAEARALRLKLWQNLRRLLSRGVVFRRARKWISVYKLPRVTVNRHRRSRSGSTRIPKPMPIHESGSKPLKIKLLPRPGHALATWPTHAESKSAMPVTSRGAPPLP